MFSLNKNVDFFRLLTMIGEQNAQNIDHSVEIDKILNSLKLTIKNWKTDTGMYSIIKYDKKGLGLGITAEDYLMIGMFRSVVVDETGKVVAFSPPKSVPITTENEKSFDNNNIMCGLNDSNTNEWYAEEFVEGTMINLFYSEKGGAWEIATKSTVGGNVMFYSPKNPKDTIEIRDNDTFRNMFFDTCSKIGFKYEELPKEKSYSFVLQHPKNRIVLPITQAAIYLVGVYNIDNESLDVTQHSISEFVDKWGGGVILNPKQLTANKYTISGFKSEYASMNSSYDMMGVVFNNMLTGDRMKIRNPNYELVKNVKGVERKCQLQYLSLRHGGRVADYLKAFPGYKNDFSVFRNHVHAFTKNLHLNYLDCFVFKRKPFGEFPQQYKKYMIGLNKKYVNELRETKNVVTYQYVMDFVNKIEPTSLFFSLNYVVRDHKKVMQRLEEPIENIENIENSVVINVDDKEATVVAEAEAEAEATATTVVVVVVDAVVEAKNDMKEKQE